MGSRLIVELDPPGSDWPDGPLGCSIRLFKPHPEHERLQAANPEAIVLLPVDSSLSIDFGPGGNVSGSGIMFKTSHPHDGRPPSIKH